MENEKSEFPGVGMKHIKGVVCDVKQCAYHDGDSYCTAKRISIGPGFAKTSGETVCATFLPKSL